MRAPLTPLLFYTTLFCSAFTHVFCQQEDSILIMHSEKWKVKPNKGMFGLAKPQFGPYTTLDISKADARTVKKKTKDGSEVSAEISSEETDLDISKYLTIAKTKSYTMLLLSGADTTKVLFAIASVSKEKRQTFLGKMLSKQDEGKDEVLSYDREITGVITTNKNEQEWAFVINHFTSGGRATAGYYHPGADIGEAWLKNDHDSLTVQTSSSFDADIVLINNTGEHLATLKFKQTPAYIWIRNDLEKTYQQSIAAFFAVIVGIRDL
jgi:hypothetical protein